MSRLNQLMTYGCRLHKASQTTELDGNKYRKHW